MAQLASDVDNRDFVGASNPDDQLWVKFDSRKHHMAFKSEQEGHPVYEMRDFITIVPPGNPNLTIEREVIESDKARFPRQWAHYKNTKDGSLVDGWMLEAWPQINAAQVEELKYRKCFTVEQLANMPDSMIQMMGMGYQELKHKAAMALQRATQEAGTNHLDEELKKRDELLAKQAEEMAEMRRQMESLMDSKPVERRRGRPAKADKE